LSENRKGWQKNRFFKEKNPQGTGSWYVTDPGGFVRLKQGDRIGGGGGEDAKADAAILSLHEMGKSL
jgi:hypothetical protein